MKKVLTFISLGIISLLWTSSLQAQIAQGSINYKLLNPSVQKKLSEKIKDQPPELQELLKNSLKSAGQTEGTLYFNQEVSVFELKNQSSKKSQGGGTVQMKVSGAGKLYKHVGDKKLVKSDEIMNKSFLIVDALREMEWTITEKTKNIGPFKAQKATTTWADKEVEAWFTESIAISTGPGRYWGLPGLILEVSEQDGWQYTFQGFSTEAPSEEQLTAPQGGKQVTQAEFDKIQLKKIEEMGGSEGGGIRIIRMGGDGN